MREDRFLTGILIGIAVLIAAALAVFFTRQDQAAYLAEDTPEAVVHSYVLAALNRDYPKAYGYLADLDHKPTLTEFRQAFAAGRLNPGANGIRVGRSSVSGDEATVEVSMLSGAGNPFSSGYSNIGTAQLIRQDGRWRIAAMPAYNLWDYGWYQPGPK